MRPILLICAIGTAFAHPMGNFSVSHYTKFEVGKDKLQATYALDLAEIPTLEVLQRWNLTAASPKAALEKKAVEQMREWTRKLSVKVDGSPVRLEVGRVRIAMTDGAGNMPVMRVTASLSAPWSGGRLEFEDRNYADRTGWKEVVATAAAGGQMLSSTAATEDRSHALIAYPPSPDKAPPQQLAAVIETPRVVVKAAAPPALVKPEQEVPTSVAPAPPVPEQKASSGEVKKGDYISTLLGRKEITWSMALLGLAAAFGLGAAHALTPGHGKTMVAAYLVGSRGTAKHAVILGAVTTFTHTISVYALGFVTLFLSQYILPDQLYPILGAISGMTIVWVGGSLFLRRLRKLHAHGHHHHEQSHDHAHEHTHAMAHAGGHSHSHGHHHHSHDHDHDHDHHHGPGGHQHVPEGEITMGSLIALGASGGLVPCPTGLVLLLSSIAIGRPGLGLIFLTAFSAGLAMVLVAIGLAVIYAKNLLPESTRRADNPFFRYMPVVSAAVICVIGCVMTVASLGIT